LAVYKGTKKNGNKTEIKMLNTLWSERIQSSHELYVSRSLRFREDNADIWLPFLRIGKNAKILELGCAGGALLHRVKQLVPGVNAVGLDRDDGHIEYARAKSAELAELELLINRRYDARLAQYRRGEKQWDIATSTVMSATGRKR
jgi:cyclopropane fatty-acyl-phospholipid synthase-like methyltransferase